MATVMIADRVGISKALGDKAPMCVQNKMTG